jgi:hypothetical protein
VVVVAGLEVSLEKRPGLAGAAAGAGAGVGAGLAAGAGEGAGAGFAEAVVTGAYQVFTPLWPRQAPDLEATLV